MTLRLLADSLLLDTDKLALSEDCCCPCETCSSTIPDELEVDITDDWVDDGCDDCDDADLSGTFTLSHIADPDFPGSNRCWWEFDFSPEACDVVRITAHVLFVDPNFVLIVAIRDTDYTAIGEYRAILGTDLPDCDAWSALSLDGEDSVQLPCSADGLTCSVTAL